jgi:NAD(P)-dependent dehydrogenase (short-subunit alcohol dehydrogenase family)
LNLSALLLECEEAHAMNLSGKVLVVTGALGSLGQAVAACLSGHGARLALLANRARPEIRHPDAAAMYTGIDLSQKDATRAIFERVFKDMGRIDGLVNLAGGFHWE